MPATAAAPQSLAVISDGMPHTYQVTHLPSGRFLACDLTRDEAHALRDALLAADLDWDWPDPAAMPAAHQQQARAIIETVLTMSAPTLEATGS